MTNGSIIGNLYRQSKSIIVKLWNELTNKDSNKIKRKVLLTIFVFSFRYSHIDIDKNIKKIWKVFSIVWIVEYLAA